MSKNKKIIIRLLFVFVSILMILSLIGCGKTLSGVYVSDYDSSRKLIFETNGILKVLSETETARYSYSVDKAPYEPGVNIVSIADEFSSNYNQAFAVKGDRLILLANDEVFIKKSFLKSLWIKHKVLIIVAFIMLGIIGILYEKYEEWKDKRDKNLH